MAPSEFDLRAALREGEGDGPDVNDVIMAAESRRAQRRVRLLSTAVVVAVVGGLAAGAAELGSSGGSSSNGSEAAAGAGQAANGDALHGAAGAPLAPAAKRALDSVPCPSAAPHYAVNAGGLNSGGAAQLVSGQVRTVVVCAYGPAFYTASAPAHRPARLELAGRQAVRLAKSLERASRATSAADCSNIATDQFALLPIDASGKVLPPVAAQLPGSACGAVVTNGTAVRYGWRPPPDVARRLTELTPTRSPDSPVAASPTPSGSSSR